MSTTKNPVLPPKPRRRTLGDSRRNRRPARLHQSNREGSKQVRKSSDYFICRGWSV